MTGREVKLPLCLIYRADWNLPTKTLRAWQAPAAPPAAPPRRRQPAPPRVDAAMVARLKQQGLPHGVAHYAAALAAKMPAKSSREKTPCHALCH